MYFLIILVVIAIFLWVVVIFSKRDGDKKIDKLIDEPLPAVQREPVHEKPVAAAPYVGLSYVHEPISKKASLSSTQLSTRAEQAEDYVNRSLSTLGHSYIIFTNLIVDKPGYIKTTEIDHVIISPYGIFCVETKSHVGSIYGSVAKKEWKQYLKGKDYSFYNPVFQNNNHAKALSLVLGQRLKSKVHSYVVFPYADKVKVNSPYVFTYTKDIIAIIDAHQKLIYNTQELSDIAYALAKYTKEYNARRDKHAGNVHEYVSSMKQLR